MEASNNMVRLDKVNVHEIMEKVQSKKEVYNFLT